MDVRRYFVAGRILQTCKVLSVCLIAGFMDGQSELADASKSTIY